VMEKSADLFAGASGKAGLKLSLGSKRFTATEAARKASKKKFYQFMRHYNQLVRYEPRTHLCVGKQDTEGNPSKITFDELKRVAQSCDRKSFEVQTDELENVEGVIQSHGMDVSVDGPRKHFAAEFKKLGIKVVFNTEAVNISNGMLIYKEGGENILCKKFDWVINCTNFQSMTNFQNAPFNKDQLVYEPYLTGLYRSRHALSGGISIVDGLFPKLEKYQKSIDNCISPDEKMYTLTHGKYSRMCQTRDLKHAKKIVEKFSKRHQYVDHTFMWEMEEQMETFYPDFGRRFKFEDSFFTIKTEVHLAKEEQPVGAFVWRQTETDCIHVLGGEQDSIFDAYDRVKELIETNSYFNPKYYSTKVSEELYREEESKMELDVVRMQFESRKSSNSSFESNLSERPSETVWPTAPLAIPRVNSRRSSTIRFARGPPQDLTLTGNKCYSKNLTAKSILKKHSSLRSSLQVRVSPPTKTRSVSLYAPSHKRENLALAPITPLPVSQELDIEDFEWDLKTSDHLDTGRTNSFEEACLDRDPHQLAKQNSWRNMESTSVHTFASQNSQRNKELELQELKQEISLNRTSSGMPIKYSEEPVFSD